MEKKNKVDGELFSEMIANFRKKYNSSSRSGGNGERKAASEAAVEPTVNIVNKTVDKPDEAVSVPMTVTEKSETAKNFDRDNGNDKKTKSSFDGILYKGEGAPSAKPKKKYSSYRSDAPLFIFDSFDEDDEEYTGAKHTEEEPLKAEKSPEVVEAKEVSEVADAEEVSEVVEAEEVSEVIDAEEVSEVVDTEEVSEVADAEEVSEIVEAEEVSEVVEAEEVSEVVEAGEVSEVIEAEEVSEVADTEEISEVAEAEEVSEVIDAEEVSEVIDAEEVSEVAEVEEVSEVIDAKEISEVIEAEEVSEVADTEEVSEVIEAEEVSEVIEAEEVSEVIEAEEISEVSEAEEVSEVADTKEISEVVEAVGDAESNDDADTAEESAATENFKNWVIGEYTPEELINVDGEYTVIKATDKNGNYKIVIAIIDENGIGEIFDVFDTEGGEDSSDEIEDGSDEEELDEIEVSESAETVGDYEKDLPIAVSEEEAGYGSGSELPHVDEGAQEESDSVHTADDGGTDGEIAVADEWDGDTVGESPDVFGSVKTIEFIDENEDDEPIVATEIEEAVSIAEEFVSDDPSDGSRNLFLGDEGLYGDDDEPVTYATEVEDISYATELTSNIIVPGEEGDESEDETEVDPDSQDESFLRECAQLELPKLLYTVKPLESPEDENGAGFVNSGYEFSELPMFDAYVREKAKKNSEGGRSRTVGADDGASDVSKDDDTLRSEFYEKRANAHRTRCGNKARTAMKSVVYTVLLAVIILFFENIGRFSDIPIVSAERAIIMLVFDIALIFVGGVIIRASLKESFSALMRFRYTCESVAILALFISAAYGVFMAVTYSGEGEIPFIGLPMIACIIYSAVLRYIAVKRDEALFNMSCDEGKYCTLAELERNSAVPELKEFDGVLGDKASIYRPDYPKRTENGYALEGSSVDVGAFGVLLTLAGVLLSVIAGVVRYRTGGTPEHAIATAVTALMTSLPVFLSVSVFAENSALIKRSAQGGALILDKKTLRDVQNGAVLLIDDTELFGNGDVKIVGFDIYNGGRTDGEVQETLGRIAGAVNALGGTLSELFVQMSEKDSTGYDVIITDISENGVSAISDGAYIRIGSASYLGKYGVFVDPDRYVSASKEGERGLYISENGSLFLSMVLSYEPCRSICKRIDRLRGYGVTVSLKTCDPCIDTELLLRVTGIEPELLKVVKYAVEDIRESEEGEHDGGIVSTRGVEGLIFALGNCARHGVSLRRLKAVSAVISLAAPAVITVAAAMAVPFTAVPIWTVGAYYGISALLGWLLAKLL